MSKRLVANSFLVLGIAALLASSSARAATRTWDGDTSQYWSDAGNWDVAPVSSDSLTFSGTSNQSNTNNAGITFINTLTLSNAGWDIKLGPSQVKNYVINATGSSFLTGNLDVTDGDRTFTLNGTSAILTLFGELYLGRSSAQKLTVNGAGNTLVLGSLRLRGSATSYTRTIDGTAHVTVTGAVTEGNSGATFVKLGAGTLTLNGVNTYLSKTAINGGTLTLGASASINKTPSITIAAGATFDVSAQAAYTLSTNLTANGAATPATIRGASSGTVSLGSKPVMLTWSGASSGVDSTHPPLTIADAQLVLNNDPLTIDVPGTALGEGVYTLISAPGGITGTVNSTPVYSGNGIDPALGSTVLDSISISGNSVILTIAVPPRGTTICIK